MSDTVLTTVESRYFVADPEASGKLPYLTDAVSSAIWQITMGGSFIVKDICAKLISIGRFTESKPTKPNQYNIDALKEYVGSLSDFSATFSTASYAGRAAKQITETAREKASTAIDLNRVERAADLEKAIEAELKADWDARMSLMNESGDLRRVMPKGPWTGERASDAGTDVIKPTETDE